MKFQIKYIIQLTMLDIDTKTGTNTLNTQNTDMTQNEMNELNNRKL